MTDNRSALEQGDGLHSGHPLGDWLRRQLFGDTGIGLDGRSLLFGTIFFVVIAIAAIVAVLLGFGTAAILAACSALFVLLAAFGGPLRSDMRMLAWFGPVFILAVGGVRLLSTVSLWGTIPVIVLLIFLAGLLPAFNSRYAMPGTALALGVLIGFGLHLPSNLPVGSLFGAIVIGVLVIALLRLFMGIGDPSLVTRKAIARVLIDGDMGAIDAAWKTLRAVRPQQWMSEALHGAEAYRVARLIISTRLEHLSQEDTLRLRSILDEADSETRELVRLIEAKKAPTSPAQRADRATAEGIPSGLQEVVVSLWQSLDRVRAAALGRDSTPVTISRLPGMSFSDTCRALFSWDSSILRHALRCAIAVLVALVIVALTGSNALTTTFLTATFAIMHPTQLGTAAKALQRAAGALFGACLAGGLALLLPPTVLLLLALLALFFAFPFMLRNMTIYFALLAVMTLLLTISARTLSSSTALLEYLLYIAVAVAIALFFIVIVPRAEPNAVKRIPQAVTAVRTLLLSISTQESVSKIRDDYILAARAVQNVRAIPGQLTKASQQRRDLIAQVARALEKLLADVSALEFQPVNLSKVAAELSVAEQLLVLDADAEHVIAKVTRPTSSNESESQQIWLVAHALAAHQTFKASGYECFLAAMSLCYTIKLKSMAPVRMPCFFASMSDYASTRIGPRLPYIRRNSISSTDGRSGNAVRMLTERFVRESCPNLT